MLSQHCNQNLTILEVLDRDVFYKEEYTYPEVRTKVGTTINLDVFSLPFTL